MNVIEGSDRLDFNNDAALDQQVSDKFANQDIFVTNLNSVLLSDHKPVLTQFDSKRVFINLLKKPATESIADSMDTGDDLFRDFIKN